MLLLAISRQRGEQNLAVLNFAVKLVPHSMHEQGTVGTIELRGSPRVTRAALCAARRLCRHSSEQVIRGRPDFGSLVGIGPAHTTHEVAGMIFSLGMRKPRT